MNKTTLNRAIGLLEELIYNGDRDQLPPWFIANDDLIVDTLMELKVEEANLNKKILENLSRGSRQGEKGDE